MKNILFAGNIRVFDGILTAILSILKRTKSKEPFRFYVFTMNLYDIDESYLPITDKMVKFLDEIIKEYNILNEVVRIDVTEHFKTHFLKSPNNNPYCSPYTLIRLFADLYDMPDKLLYLDADIMLNRDISLLYDIDVSNYEYAAARDHYGKYLVSPNYINAGVILFNMKKCRETGLFIKSRAWLNRKKLPFADQSAIIRSTTKRLMLAQRFNDQKFLHKHTVIRHFSKRLFYLPYPHNENIKQWHITKVHKRFGYEVFDDILYEYIYLKEKFRRQNND